MLREGGIPLTGLLRRIVCRTPAEMQTLFSLIQSHCPQQYDTYKSLITYASADLAANMFYQSGMYVKAVKATEEGVFFQLNEPRLRYDALKERKKPVEVSCYAKIYWKNNNGEIVNMDEYRCNIDYKQHAGINLRYTPRSTQFRLELRVDEEKHLLFCGEFNIEEHSIM